MEIEFVQCSTTVIFPVGSHYIRLPNGRQILSFGMFVVARCERSRRIGS